ncbi:hamartin-like isoform X2 [Acropora millepora]|uniref:hamartin-like isoform X2 n=1 Tax=Acropora millepora TaxID=45264 RepID=UPI001CF3EF1C|nr:hamartin-like isoform X2 [Acropora millepora]
MASTTESSSPSNQRDLFSLLDADNIETAEETKALILENLHSSRDPGLLNSMVDYYLKTRSSTCLQILTGIHEARGQALFEKMNESLKHRTTRLDTLTLLGHIVRKQPSWLHKIVKTPLFDAVLKHMKADTDVVVLTSAVLTITTMLPLIPTYVGPWLPELFDIFVRLSSFRAHSKVNPPEVHLLHLHVAVYMFFHRLYAMYPNNFLMYLRNLHNEPSKRSLFQDIIKPMLENVRVHPCVVTETEQTETNKHRWKQKEPHDIVVECMKVSLDPIDRIQEEGNFMSSSTYRQSRQEIFADKSVTSILTASCDSEGFGMEKLKERRMSDSATQTGKSLQSGDSGTDCCSLPVVSSTEIGWSPSEFCQLSTPPSSRMSPSTSNPDLLSSLNILSRCSTPAGVYTPGQSPTASLGGDEIQAQGYSSSSSFSGSRGKDKGMTGMFSDQVISPRSEKTVGHDGLLARALISALTLQSPKSNHRHQTSTPNEQLKCQEVGEIESEMVVNHGTHDVLPKSPSTSFNACGKETDSDVVKTSTEKFDHNSLNVSQKKEFRDLGKEGDDCLEISKLKAAGSRPFSEHRDVLAQSQTVVGDQAFGETHLLDESKLSSESTCSTTEVNGSLDATMESELDSDGLVNRSQFNDHAEGNVQVETNKSETSTASCDAPTDFSKCNTTSSASQVNHHASFSRELIAAFPQLLHLMKGYQECNNFNGCSDEPSFSRPQSHALSCRASPVEILDSFLKTGTSVHHGELSRVPLVSQAGATWTHFGGEPPADEVEILRGQVKLLHNQLLFERHKCDLHAIRNRRLIGKTFKAVQHQEELQATKDQLRLQEDKMRELSDALNKQMEESRKFKSVTSGWENHQGTELRNLQNENAKLKDIEKELLEKLETQKKESDLKHTEVQQLKAKIFTLENELDRLKVESTEKDQLKIQVNHLVKEVLLMGELNQQHKDAIKKLTVAETQNPESSMQLQSCLKELSAAKQTMKKQTAEVEALTSKLADMETLVSSKDVEIRDMKKFVEGLKGTFSGKIQSLEEKYNAQKKMTQALEAYILDAQAVETARKEKIASETLQS